MQSSFQLPNEVNCSNKRNSPQTNLEQNKMIATERKRVSTDSTRIARSSEGVPIGTRNVESFGTRNVVNVACGAKTLAQHETTLKILKLVCVVFAVSTVISTATFGGILYNLVS